MTKKYLQKNIVLLANQTLVVAFLVYEIIAGVRQDFSSLASFGVITVLFSLAANVGLSNIKGSRILTSFSALLILVEWYFLLNTDKGSLWANLSDYILPIIIYCMIAFLLRFVLQNGAYPHKNWVDMILLISAVLPILLKPFSDRWFALAHLCQYIIGLICCVFVFITQKKRVSFFIKSEWKNLLPSIGIFCVLMSFYIAIFRYEPRYLENSGMFLITCLPLWSVFKVAYHSKKTIYKFLPLSNAQISVIIVLLITVLCGISCLFGLDSVFLLLTTQIVLWFFVLYYLFVIWNVANKSTLAHERYSNYSHALSQVEKEEALKKQFSDFLHDEVLQDLLAVKNLMSKAERPAVRDLITETLDKLNRTVREEMQDYHLVILNNLTLKENYKNLVSALSQKFNAPYIEIEFECADDLFLAMPYHLVIYRAIRELVTNAYKHSDCTKIHVALAQSGGQIDLMTTDNGGGKAKEIQTSMELRKGKGLVSIEAAIISLGGKLNVTDNATQGVCVHLSLPMKGEGSYQYFAHR